MNTSIIPASIPNFQSRDLPLAQYKSVFVETHRRRAAVFAAIANNLHDAPGVSDLSFSMEYDRHANQQIVRDLVSVALGCAPTQDNNAAYGSPARAEYVAKRSEWIRIGSELRVTFSATIDGEAVKCDVRCRPQAKRRGYDGREPVNKLVLWHGLRSRRRGYGDETRVVESSRNGFPISAIRNAIVERMRAMVETVRQARVARAERDRETVLRRERQRVARVEREAQQAREREQRDANRREVEALRREASLMLGLEGIAIDVGNSGAFTVRYTTTTAITDVAELRRKLQALSDAFVPPLTPVENDPDDDDDDDWRATA